MKRNQASESSRTPSEMNIGKDAKTDTKSDLIELIMDPKWSGPTFGALLVAITSLLYQSIMAQPSNIFTSLIFAAMILCILFLLFGVLWIIVYRLPNKLVSFDDALATASKEVAGTAGLVGSTSLAEHGALVTSLLARQEDMIKELDQRLLQARAHARELQARMSPHLITWEESISSEISASEVCCITSTLDWAHWAISQIIHDCVLNPKKRYQYLIHFDGSFDHATELEQNFKHIFLAIESAVHSGKEYSRLYTQIQLRFFLEGKARAQAPVCMKEWPPKRNQTPKATQLSKSLGRLPIAGDFVIYKSVKLREDDVKPVTIAVVSATWPDTSKEFANVRSNEESVDLRLQDPRQYDPILLWFQSKWHELDASTDDEG